MATGGAQQPRADPTETAGERRVPDNPRRLRELLELQKLLQLLELLELRQRQLRSRIAACEKLTAAVAELQAMLSPRPAGGAGL